MHTINTIVLPTLGGTVTFFCMNCGEEIHPVFDRTVSDMEQKYQRTTEENHRQMSSN